MPESDVYRIRNNRLGLFMTKRGRYPVWSETGNVYNTLSACKSALKTRDRRWLDKKDISIVGYMLVESEVIDYDE